MDSKWRAMIDRLSRDEKLQLVDSLWESLTSNIDEVAMPVSHELEFQKREQRIAEGISSFSDWDEARSRLFSRAKSP